MFNLTETIRAIWFRLRNGKNQCCFLDPQILNPERCVFHSPRLQTVFDEIDTLYCPSDEIKNVMVGGEPTKLPSTIPIKSSSIPPTTPE